MRQVGEPAPALDRFRKTVAVVAHPQLDAVRRREVHVDVVGVRMARGVRERFAEHRQQVGGQLGRDAGVDGAVEVDVRLELGAIGDVVHELEDLGPQAAVLMGLQREDAGADLADRLVDLVDGLHEPGPVRVPADVRRDRLQHHPDREEPLDDRVVEVARRSAPGPRAGRPGHGRRGCGRARRRARPGGRTSR